LSGENRNSALQKNSPAIAAGGVLGSHIDSDANNKTYRGLQRDELKKSAAPNQAANVAPPASLPGATEPLDQKAERRPPAPQNQVVAKANPQPPLPENESQSERANAKQPAAAANSQIAAAAATPAPVPPPAPPIAKDLQKSNPAETTTAETSAAAPPISSRSVESTGKFQPPSALAASRAKLASHTAAAPGGAVIWRWRPGGAIERSSDRGKTWSPQNSGLHGELLAGSAPSDSVCWLAGRGGAILRTTDAGAHWTPLVGPFPADITAIVATDALHATIVTASPPAHFSTADGGLALAPVREIR
jgi:hypothetical protein